MAATTRRAVKKAQAPVPEKYKKHWQELFKKFQQGEITEAQLLKARESLLKGGPAIIGARKGIKKAVPENIRIALENLRRKRTTSTDPTVNAVLDEQIRTLEKQLPQETTTVQSVKKKLGLLKKQEKETQETISTAQRLLNEERANSESLMEMSTALGDIIKQMINKKAPSGKIKEVEELERTVMEKAKQKYREETGL